MFMRNKNYSMFLKSWTLFMRLGPHVASTRENMEINSSRPWKEEESKVHWQFEDHYGHNILDYSLCNEEKSRQWFGYLERWYQ